MNKKELGSKENPFKVPENYFENFKMRFPQPVTAHLEGTKDVVRLWPLIKPWLTLAAIFTIIALVYYQVPRMFLKDELSAHVSSQNGDSWLNSLALMIDEQDINALIMEQDSTMIPAFDTNSQLTITEEELALLTMFE